MIVRVGQNFTEALIVARVLLYSSAKMLEERWLRCTLAPKATLWNGVQSTPSSALNTVSWRNGPVGGKTGPVRPVGVFKVHVHPNLLAYLPTWNDRNGIG